MRPGRAELIYRRGSGTFPARARSVILLMQNGGPSQVDLFDPKPELQKRSGQRHPQQVESFQPGSQANLLMGSAFRFRKHGECGMELSELLPHIGSVADDICLVRSMVGDNNNHPQGLQLHQHGENLPRPADVRGLGELCLGHAQPEPAGLRRAPRS